MIKFDVKQLNKKNVTLLGRKFSVHNTLPICHKMTELTLMLIFGPSIRLTLLVDVWKLAQTEWIR